MPGTILGNAAASVKWDNEIRSSIFHFDNGAKTHKKSWQSFIDGYYSQYGRNDKNKPSVATLIYCRDLAMMYLGNTQFKEFKTLCFHLADKWGVDLLEGMQYVKDNPEWKDQLTSTENLESGDLGEALGNAFQRFVVAPVAGVLSTIGSGLTSVIFQFLKKLLPVILLIVTVWFLFNNRHKLISKK